ncbi:methyl coenzyme M reductase subunit gamma [uncultured Rothia sp.]|uniref:methyl coenzyme M reductase subunit gamma n=1 Tax=uncultured Rothia sp. TaxID=316088 RepID=UPI0028DB0530|nr:methyl coenzyme M reductase subunit gamma [uncultured Rothia sp.]
MMFSRTTRASIAVLSAAMLLTLSACSGGAQVKAESNASTSASAEASATPTPTPSPTPTGSEVVEIRAAVDTTVDSEEARKAAGEAGKQVLAQDVRLRNAWMQGDLEHTSEEDLAKFLEPKGVKSTLAGFADLRETLQEGPFGGQIEIRDVEVVEVSASTDQNGQSTPNAVVRVQYCEDWGSLRWPNGEPVVDGSPSSPAAEELRENTMIRRPDGVFVIQSGRKAQGDCKPSQH